MSSILRKDMKKLSFNGGGIAVSKYETEGDVDYFKLLALPLIVIQKIMSFLPRDVYFEPLQTVHPIFTKLLCPGADGWRTKCLRTAGKLSMTAVARNVLYTKNITTIDFSFYHEDCNDVIELAVKKLPHLSILYLRRCVRLKNDTIKFICQHGKDIRALDLSENRISLTVVFLFILKHSSTLQELGFPEDIDADPDVIQDVRLALMHCNKLTIIRMVNRSSMYNYNWTSVITYVLTMPTIRILDGEGNYLLGSECMPSVFKCSRFTALAELNLSHTDIGDNQLVCAIPRMSGLHTLNLASNYRLSDTSFNCIAHHLLNLSYLNINSCYLVTDHTCATLLNGLPKLRDLLLVECKQVTVSTPFLNAIVQSANLCFLDFSHVSVAWQKIYHIYHHKPAILITTDGPRPVCHGFFRKIMKMRKFISTFLQECEFGETDDEEDTDVSQLLAVTSLCEK